MDDECSRSFLILISFMFFKKKRIIVLDRLLKQKGTTKLAMYGLGHVRDQRLHRTFEGGKVKFLRPDVDPSSWFNIFAVHQNRFVCSRIFELVQQSLFAL